MTALKNGSKEDAAFIAKENLLADHTWAVPGKHLIQGNLMIDSLDLIVEKFQVDMQPDLMK